MKCRICGCEDYESIINLGNIHPSNFLDNGATVEQAPLHLVQCKCCELVQLKESIDLDRMYKDFYWYRSGLNQNMVNSLRDVVDSVMKKVDLKKEDSVLDIGCNDGTMLGFYPDYVCKAGIDPAPNLNPQNIDLFINDYFLADYFNDDKKYKVITAIAMFYDLEDPNKFLQDIKSILSYDGIFIVQFTDLLSMVKINAFDNICHEHLEYYSLKVLNDLMIRNDLRIFDVEYNSVNGGSIRAYIRHDEDINYCEVNHKINKENEYFRKFPIKNFGNSIEQTKRDLLRKVSKYKKKNKRIYVLGASTKGNTLLQYYGLDNTIIDKALEVNEDKFGKHTIGTNIPIVSEKDGLAEKPDYLLVLPWHFRDFFVDKLDSYIKQGGALIFPLPEVEIVR